MLILIVLVVLADVRWIQLRQDFDLVMKRNHLLLSQSWFLDCFHSYFDICIELIGGHVDRAVASFANNILDIYVVLV